MSADVKPMATPWFNQGVTIMGPAGYYVASTQIDREHARVSTDLALANAAFIVLACNSFDALTEANKKLVLALERARDDLDHLAFNIVREDGEAMTQEGAGNFAQRSYERVCDAISGAK